MNDPFFDDDADEYLKHNTDTKKRSEPTPEEKLKEEVYNRRCKLVRYSHVSYSRFLEYLRDNEDFFKKNLSNAEKENIRRVTCERAWTENSSVATIYDLELFDRVFGPSIDARASKTIPVYGCDGNPMDDDPKKYPIEKQLNWYGNSTYETFWNWVNDADTQSKLKGRKDLVDNYDKLVEEQIRHNYVMFKGRKEYEEQDYITYMYVRNLMLE